jgi:hypothetical protein
VDFFITVFVGLVVSEIFGGDSPSTLKWMLANHRVKFNIFVFLVINVLKSAL